MRVTRILRQNSASEGSWDKRRRTIPSHHSTTARKRKQLPVPSCFLTQSMQWTDGFPSELVGYNQIFHASSSAREMRRVFTIFDRPCNMLTPAHRSSCSPPLSRSYLDLQISQNQSYTQPPYFVFLYKHAIPQIQQLHTSVIHLNSSLASSSGHDVSRTDAPASD